MSVCDLASGLLGGEFLRPYLNIFFFPLTLTTDYLIPLSLSMSEVPFVSASASKPSFQFPVPCFVLKEDGTGPRGWRHVGQRTHHAVGGGALYSNHHVVSIFSHQDLVIFVFKVFGA